MLFRSVADRHLDFAVALQKELQAQGFRVEVDASTESVGKKIRGSEQKKVPVALVVGDKEVSGEPLTVRVRGEKDQLSLTKEAFVAFVEERIREKK